MLYYLTAAALVLHTYFWGAGLAWLATPRVWRRQWWAFAPGFGLALQSAVVWTGAHTSLPGTNAYAWWSELLPLGLLVAAARRRGTGWLRNWRGGVGVAAMMLAAGWLLVSPMTKAGRLTSSSLGSCDHADYAAGARTFQEFSRGDRTGFLGETEVTRVGATDCFFEFWLRLNHFTPSALLAHNCSILGRQPHELASLTGAVLVLLNLPVMLLLARVTVRLRTTRLLVLTALYAVSPLTGYAVHHGALGQLYAAHGIALLTLAVFGASRTRCESVRAFAPLVLAMLWLLAGSYNFILTVALAPAAAWLLFEGVQRRDMRGPVRAGAMVAAMSGLCVVLFWGRFDGLIERFRLFEQFDFGWPVPLLTPEGWLGFVRDPALHAWPAGARVVLSAGVMLFAAIGGIMLWRRNREAALAALALTLPVLGGYAMLAWEARVRANASYDAFKLLSVFYPGLLSGLLCWLAVRPRSVVVARLGGALVAAILGVNLMLAGEMRRLMQRPPLRLETTVVGLGGLEPDPRIASLNMRIDDFWTRLWANEFLLRKPQYFLTHTYEGRLNTPLKGQWDLSDSLLRAVPVNSAADYRDINGQFHAVRVGGSGRIELGYGGGWYEIEGRGAGRWRWSSGDGEIRVHNAASTSVSMHLTAELRAVTPRDVELRLNGRTLVVRALGDTQQSLDFGTATLPAGDSTLVFHSLAPATSPAGDTRRLAVALYRLTAAVVAEQ
jgi:hypothetical protein